MQAMLLGIDRLSTWLGQLFAWAIVLLTIVIKTIFFPLQAASYRSMARMKAVTPRLTQIRERYGLDRPLAEPGNALHRIPSRYRWRGRNIHPAVVMAPDATRRPVRIAR